MDFFTILMLGVLVVMIVFMIRGNKKRQKQQLELQTQMVSGVRVMTNFGVYGTLVSVDEAENIASIEISPGVVMSVHKQAVVRVVEESKESEPLGAVQDSSSTDGVPEYGELASSDDVSDPETHKK